MSLQHLILSGLAGLVVGFLSGVFGIGGGFLIVPVLNIALNVPMNLAVGAGACHVLGPATTSLLARRIHFDDLRLPLTVTGGLLLGVVAGAIVFQSIADMGEIVVAGRAVSSSELVVLSLYFLLMAGLGAFALWQARSERLGRPLARGWLVGWKIPPLAQFPEFANERVSIPVLSWFGLAVGFLSGLLGMSGGLLLLPGLVYLLGMRTQQAVVSSLIIVWIVAAQATAAHAWHGNIRISLVVALLLGGTIGARLGSELSVKLGGRQLRAGFGWLLLTAAALIALQLARLLLV